jgi:hypothetical protein
MTNPEQDRSDLDALLREHGGMEGLARELGQGDPAAALYEDANDNNGPTRSGYAMIRWLLRQNAGDLLFVVIAAALLAAFVWTLL